MPAAGKRRSAYNERGYRAARAALRRGGGETPCTTCGIRPATQLDHQPPLALHAHEPGTGCCELFPVCQPCNGRGGQRIALVSRRRRAYVRAQHGGQTGSRRDPSRQW